MNSVSSFAMNRAVLSLDGPLATVKLNRPALNVLDFQMMDEPLVTLQALERRSEVAAIVLTGGERAFSAGVDVGIHTPDKIQTMLQKFHGLIAVLAKLRKITLAEVRGACLGGGAELAMVCDLIFTGRTISGEEAAAWGLANEAHPDDRLTKAVRGTLDYLVKLSPAALSVAKKAFYGWDSVHLDKGLGRAEKIYVEELMQTEDAREGINAWLQKRKPEW